MAQRIVPLPRGREHVRESHLFSRVLLAAKEVNVKLVYSRCAGLDVHKDTVFVSIRRSKGKNAESISAVFQTFTEDLEKLREFLQRHKVHRVVMESTGVYWIPIWNVLERSKSWKFDVVLAIRSTFALCLDTRLMPRTQHGWRNWGSMTCFVAVSFPLYPFASYGI